jgi:steroid delta-isomerase
MTREPALERLVHFYESIGAATLRAELGALYAPAVQFKDPFNDVHGVDKVVAIFEHMFVQVDAPRFVVKSAFMQGREAFLTWDFLFTMKRFSKEGQCIHGATHIVFDDAGMVMVHRDYWDAAEELYEKLPLLGSLMRWLKRRANH